MKSKLRLNAAGFSTIYSTPPFANTMLGDRPDLYFVLQSIFFFI